MIPIEVFHESIRGFLSPVQAYLEDPSVTEIMVNGADAVYVERRGRLERTSVRFENREVLWAAIRNIAQFVGKNVGEDHPLLEARLPDGSRVQVVCPPVAPDGPFLSIRRFAREALSMDRLVGMDALTDVARDLLGAMVTAKLNILVAGGTGSGKTSLLGAMSSYISSDERIVVIEDTREVQLQQSHVVHLESRSADAKGHGAISMRELFRSSLRLRPDRILVGEVRGGEALDIIQAMTSGHGGCMGTVHASHPREALGRLETLTMMADIGLPIQAVRMQIGSGVHAIVQMNRLRDGSRKVTHVSEVCGYDANSQQFLVTDILRREYQGVDAQGLVRSELVPTGAVPAMRAQLLAYGVDVPTVLIGKAGKA